MCTDRDERVKVYTSNIILYLSHQMNLVFFINDENLLKNFNQRKRLNSKPFLFSTVLVILRDLFIRGRASYACFV